MYNLIKIQDCGKKFLFSNGKGEFILASYSTVFESPECLLFSSDSEGEVQDWIEVYGEKHDSSTKPNQAILSTVDTFNKLLEGNNYNGAWAK